MTEYCRNKDRAVITFTIDGQSERLEVSPTPVKVEENPVGAIDPSTHCNNMIEPINIKTYGEIETIKLLTPTFAKLNAERNQETERPCPIPQIVGDRLVSYFDGQDLGNYELNKYGCCYEVYYKGGDRKQLKVTDGNGNTVYDKTGNIKNLKVGCDSDCPDGHIKCQCNKYPGYCCIDCNEYVEKIKNAARRIK
jgi:hypothetical protein